MANLKDRYKTEIVKKMRQEFSFGSDFEVPRVEKVTINVGAGKALDSPEIIKTITAEIAAISGQKPRTNKSKKSVSGFKLREGEIIGVSATLRGRRMYDFIERLVNVVLPRVRDFRGLALSGFDQQANYSIGLREQTVFPEIKPDQIKETYGLQINITTSKHDRNQAKRLLELLGFPFSAKAPNESTKLTKVPVCRQAGKITNK